MILGAEPKKVVALGALLLVGGYFFYSNVISDSNDAPARQPGPAASHNAAVNSILSPEPTARGPVVRSTSKSKASEEFRPSLKRKPEDAPDPSQIDPTLRLDKLAKVQSVMLEGSLRNPFQFGAAPPPPAPAVKVDPVALAKAKANQAAPPPPTAKPAPTGPPPLNLPWKYYGFTSPRGAPQKKAFFLDGEDILTANEGEVLKKKYRVVRIGVNSVVVEDTDTKSQQTLPLAEEAA